MNKPLIKKLANELLEQSRQTEPPVNLKTIAENLLLKIELNQAGRDGPDGGLVPGQNLIKLNLDKPTRRQRFTFAHEIGHSYLFHRHRLNDDDNEITGIYDTRDDDEVWHANRVDADNAASREREANFFAAVLLMPDAWVKAAWAKNRNAKMLADLFDVSEETIWVRLLELKLV